MTKAVFLDYDQQALDAQYNLRARFPTFQNHFDRWAKDSAAVRRDLECRLDVPYGKAAGEKMDIFPAPGSGNPVHVFIHGGYWQFLDKQDFSYLAPPLVNAGCAVVVLNYDLAPAVTVDEIVRQVRAALAWIYRQASSFGGDAERISVSGHSAGAHLAAMAMLHNWVAEDLPADLVKGVCAISGIYDLQPLRWTYQNEALRLDDESAARNSPVQLQRGSSASLVVALGSLEPEEFHRQATAFVAARSTQGQPCQVLSLAGHDHFSIADQLADPGSELFGQVRTLL